MNLLSEVAGNDGENLVTVVFRFLLAESADTRQAFLELIANKVGVLSIDIKTYFCCKIEEQTRSETDGDGGYLDLLLETRTMVIGIENKLAADFTENQPHKYLDSVSSRALDLSKRFGGEPLEHYVFVIGPEFRESEILAHIAGNLRLKFLSWQDVLSAIDSNGQRCIEMDRVLADFRAYVNERSAFLPNFEKWLPMSRSMFPQNGSEEQKQLIEQIKQILPAGVSRSAGGPFWYGCHFGLEQGVRAWFGYIRSSDLIGQQGRYVAELIVVTSAVFSLPTDSFLDIEFPQVSFLYRNRESLRAWIVNYDEHWGTLKRWKLAFEPLKKAFENDKAG